jgi:ABC-type spermidine/putrescine transport system permease subunit I
MIGISIVYTALIFVVSQFYQSGFDYGYGGYWQVILYIITLCAMIYISIIYSMSIFGRVKYKLSAIDSLKYSRMLTKGKRGKILGNVLLMALISVVLLLLLAFGLIYLFYYHEAESEIILYFYSDVDGK